MGLNYVALGIVVIGFFVLAIINFFVRKKTQRDNLVQGNIAVISGLLFLFSILSDWVLSGEQIISGPDIEKIFPETPILGTAFNFMYVFAALTIIGGILLLSNYEVGRKLIYYSGRLSIIFSLLCIYIFSTFPMTRPYWMAYFTLIMSVVSLISIYLFENRNNVLRKEIIEGSQKGVFNEKLSTLDISPEMEAIEKINCIKCGAENKTGNDYCRNCGTKFKSE